MSGKTSEFNSGEYVTICTEIRDYGYRTINAYAQALAAGECQPHPETFYVRLDELAIYQYGSDENIYTTICGISQ